MSQLAPQRLSAIHRRHLSLGAAMVEQEGWQRPARYTGSQQELAGLRAGVGLCDISPMGKLYVEGDAIASLLKASLPEAELPEAHGVARQQVSLSDGSPMVDLTLCRLAQDQALALTTPEGVDGVRGALEAERAERHDCAHLVDLTSALTGLCLAGPRSQDCLSRLTDLDLSLPTTADMTCAQTTMAAIQATMVRMDNQAGPCYWIFVSRDLGEYAWDTLTEAGSGDGLVPFGIEALRLLAEEG